MRGRSRGARRLEERSFSVNSSTAGGVCVPIPPGCRSSSEGTVSALKAPVFEFERKQAQSSGILAHGDLWLERRRAAVAGEILRFAGVEHVLFRCVSRDLGNSDEIRRGSHRGVVSTPMIVPAPKVPDARTRNCVDYSAGCAFRGFMERENSGRRAPA